MNHCLLWLASAFAAGVWCGGFYQGKTALLYLAAAGVVVLSGWWIRQGVDRRAFGCLVALFFVVGMIRFIHADTVSPLDISHYDGQMVTVSGTVSEVPVITKIDAAQVRVKYVIDVQSVQTPGSPPGSGTAANGRSLLYTRQPAGDTVAAYGQSLSADGKITLPHGYNNPGVFDSVGALKRQGITARMSVPGAVVLRADSRHSKSWQTRVADCRDTLIGNMRKVMPPGDAAMLGGMLFGGYDGINREVVNDFATTGIVHILSVSGTHIALVAGVILWCCNRLKVRYAVMLALAASAIVFYSVLSGLTSPVVRSAIMGLVVLGAAGLGREKDVPSALSLAALILLVYQPGLLYDISFQLSFGSTAGLVFLYTKTVKWLSFLPVWLAEAFGVTIAAQLAVLPFIAWYFNSFSFSSFIANILVVPIVEFVVIIGLFGSMIGLFIPAVGHILLVVSSLLIGFVIQINAVLAALPLARIYIPALPLAVSMLYYAVLAWVYGYHPQRIMPCAAVLRRWPRHALVVAGLGVIVVLGIALYPRAVYVHFIDVGQGDAALITTPHGHAIMVDTGGTLGENTDFDIGERVVLPYLRHYGVLSLDYLFLTHGHQDHAGGAAAIVAAIPVRNILLTRDGQHTAAVQALEHAAAMKGQAVLSVYPGQTVQLDGVTVTVLYAAKPDAVNNLNEASSLIRMDFGRQSFLFTGDLDSKGEEEFLAQGVPQGCTVLKVGHHGANTSSSADFLQAIHPKYAVISVGYNNHFGHPHPDTLRRLSEANCQVYRTDRQGAVRFCTDGEHLSIRTYVH